jgi:hypothetical protein
MLIADFAAGEGSQPVTLLIKLNRARVTGPLSLSPQDIEGYQRV